METIEYDKPIEKALEDWGAEITGINTLLGCCELLRGWLKKPQSWRRLR